MHNKPRKPLQFGLASLFGMVLLMSAALWPVFASRDALVLFGLVAMYVTTIAMVLYVDPSRDS